MKPTDLLGFTIWLAEFLGLASIEGKDTLSKSEIRRWIRNGSILINGERPTTNDWQIEFPITELVLFPKGKRKTTLL